MNWKKLVFIISSLGVIALVYVCAAPAFAAEAIATGKEALMSGALSGDNKAVMALAAMGSVAFSCITSAYALAKIGTAAMGTMGERPEVGGRALVFLGMAEGIAIYGLIISIMILNKI